MVNRPRSASEGKEQASERQDPTLQLRQIIRSAASEAMKPASLKKIESTVLEFFYRIQVAACETPDDFRTLFALHGFANDQEWRRRLWKENRRLQEVISRRFGGWEAFLEFMGVSAKQLPLDKNILTYPLTEQVAACETPDDFHTLFALHGYTNDQEWRTGLQRKNPGLQNAIRLRFGRGKTFLSFMGPAREKLPLDKNILTYPLTEQVAACETPDDFRTLFALHGYTNDQEWRKGLKKENPQLQTVISRRFGGWEAFLEFMGVSAKQLPLDKNILNYQPSEQVAACETPDDFHTLFALHGYTNDQEWRTGLQRKNPGLQKAIRLRFGGWEAFLEFMGPAREKLLLDKSILNYSYPQQVAACETPDDFRTLFALHGYTNDQEWERGLHKKNPGLQDAIRLRSGTWKAFLEFMGSAREKLLLDKSILNYSYPQQVAACETPDDFLKLFQLHKIPDKERGSSVWLRSNGYEGLYAAIKRDPRFSGDGWAYFNQWMNGLDDESSQKNIERLGLEEAVALFGKTPAIFKRYLQIHHKELDEGQVNKLVTTAYKGLINRKTFDYSKFDLILDPIVVTKPPKTTKENVITLSGTAPGADSVFISGNCNRRVRTAADDSFSCKVALSIGEDNAFSFVGLSHEKKLRSEEITCSVRQTGQPDDIDALVKLLEGAGTKALEDIRKDPGRFEFIVRSAEQVLIKRFSKSFEQGRNYIEELMEKTKSASVKKVFKTVLDRFRVIDRTRHPNVRSDSPLYFFQKYCVVAIQRKMEEGARGVILANAPGTGKTRTGLVAVNGERAVVVSPNSVVSAWGEEAAKCLQHSDVLTLQNIPHKKRMELLRNSDASHIVTNIEFLRSKKENDERYDLLSDDDTIVVYDEAHALTNLESEQSRGARRLKGKFHLYLSATPYKNPRTMRRMLHTLLPHDKRFVSDKAFCKAFPASDPKALQTLSVLVRDFVIRFRKEDVLEEMDPDIPVADQHHRLPRKEHVKPEECGEFTMDDTQANAMYEMFMNWPAWTRKYDQYVPKDGIAKMDNLRGNQNVLTKRHALRQTANNPAYIGATNVEDAKTAEMLRTVEQCRKEGRKVVIFCAYNAQSQKYAELLKKYNPALYTGITSKEKLKKNKEGEAMLFRQHPEGGWELDGKGYPIEDESGTPMLAMDYERLTFQNSQDREVIIATYSAGAVGVTFTAGKAVILDDLPKDYIEEIQAEDRTHRIDHEHQTHHSVKYIRMISRYSEKFLEKMKKKWVVKKKDGTFAEYDNRNDAEHAAKRRKTAAKTAFDAFFAQGTFDEVQFRNLQVQRQMFQLINDGISDESVLSEGQQQFLGADAPSDLSLAL